MLVVFNLFLLHVVGPGSRFPIYFARLLLCYKEVTRNVRVLIFVVFFVLRDPERHQTVKEANIRN